MKTQRVASSRPARAQAPARAAFGFKAFIAYDDLDAARGAMKAIDEVLQAAPRGYQLQPMLWRFDQLCSDKWREPSLANAAEADVVVLASSAPGPLTSFVERWVGELLAAKKRMASRATLVALLGQDDAWTISIEPTCAASVPAATTEFPVDQFVTATKAA
jgi:hypothetical protein